MQKNLIFNFFGTRFYRHEANIEYINLKSKFEYGNDRK